MIINKSSPELHEELTNIAVNSKKYWNYPEEWIKFWEEDLTLSEDYIQKNNVYHIYDQEDKILGFYSFFVEDKHIRLEHLFILPDNIGKGIGKILLNDFFKRIDNKNFDYIILDADPNAEDFYKKFGFKTIEIKPTKLEDRFLPVMLKNIKK